MPHSIFRRVSAAGAAAAAFACVSILRAADPLPQDRGATGTWQKLLKLRTIASVMHTTAHPDDEHGGLLALLSRGDGARVSLLTLNRGEAGDNAIGSELFDALGLIRTEELLPRISTTASISSTSRTSSITASRSAWRRRSRSGDATASCVMSCASSGWSGRSC